MLALTEDAINAIELILSDRKTPQGGGVRIAVNQNAAAAGDDLTIAIVEVPASTDEVIDQRGARLFVDERAREFLDDKLLDANSQGEEVRFAVKPRP